MQRSRYLQGALSALLLFLLAHEAVADDRAVVQEYIKARCATLSKGATPADVQSVLALLTDNAVIEHPAFNQLVRGKEAIRRGLESHLNEYTGTPQESGIVVLDSIDSPGVVALKIDTTFVVGEGADRKVVSRHGLMMAEVRGLRIARLIEY